MSHQRLGDAYAEIVSLLSRYCWLVDRRRWDEWALCFAEDGAFVARGHRWEGRAAIVEYVQAEVARFTVIRHLSHIPEIVLESEISARCRSYFELRAATLRGADTHGLGSYEDVVTRAGGCWAFAERRADFDYWVRRGEPWFSDSG